MITFFLLLLEKGTFSRPVDLSVLKNSLSIFSLIITSSSSLIIMHTFLLHLLFINWKKKFSNAQAKGSHPAKKYFLFIRALMPSPHLVFCDSFEELFSKPVFLCGLKFLTVFGFWSSSSTILEKCLGQSEQKKSASSIF